MARTRKRVRKPKRVKRKSMKKRMKGGGEEITPMKRKKPDDNNTITFAPKKVKQDPDTKPDITKTNTDLDIFDEKDNRIEKLRGIGEKSRNGFVVQYENNDKKFVLKSSRTENNKTGIIDNLVYEYKCGIKINDWRQVFSCFIHTHRLFEYEPGIGKIRMVKFLENQGLYSEKQKDLKLNDLQTTINPHSNDGNYNCDTKNNYALMLDYFPGKSLSKTKFYKRNMPLDQLDIPDIVFQIYAPLYALGSENFLHLDLHAGNIMVYEVPFDFCLKYTFNDEEIEENEINVYTNSIVKLVDYGRAYIKNITQPFLDKLKQIKDPMKKEHFVKSIINCGLGHIVGNRYETSETDLRYLTSPRSYVNILKNSLEQLNKNPSRKEDDIFTIHIDCKKYENENERSGMYYTGNIPEIPSEIGDLESFLDLFGVVWDRPVLKN
jgi:hypothetical protein